MSAGPPVPRDADKAQLRAELSARRAGVPAGDRAEQARMLARHLGRLRLAPVDGGTGTTVCAYLPVGSEPGSPAMLDALAAAGHRVLLPVARVRSGVPAPLDWGVYRPDGLVPAPFGLREPVPPWLGPAALGTAAAVVLPALAADRRGVRLGRGAGFYDRSLGAAHPGALLIAVVGDDEVFDRLPAEPHDLPVSHLLTPAGGLQPVTPEPE